MKFGQSILERADPRFADYYISYKQLKQAIKLITGSDTSAYTIQQVNESFGHIRALGGSIYRPPESRFQDLLQHELEKINSFSTDFESRIKDTLIEHTAALGNPNISEDALRRIDASIESIGRDIVLLEEYQRLNFTGFRKIIKKYDKNSSSASSTWFMSSLVMEPFMNINFDGLLATISSVSTKLRDVCEDKNITLSNVRTTGGSLVSITETANASIGTPSPAVTSSFVAKKFIVPLESVTALKVLLSSLLPLAPVTAVSRAEEGGDCSLNVSVVYFDTPELNVYSSLSKKSSTTTAAPAATAKGGKKGGNAAATAAAAEPTSTPSELFRIRWKGKNTSEENFNLAVDSTPISEPCWIPAELPDAWPGTNVAMVSQQAVSAAIGGADVSYYLRPSDDRTFVASLIKNARLQKLVPQVRFHSQRTSFHQIIRNGTGIQDSNVIALIDESITISTMSIKSNSSSPNVSAATPASRGGVTTATRGAAAVLNDLIVGADKKQNNDQSGKPISLHHPNAATTSAIWPYLINSDIEAQDISFYERTNALGFALLELGIPSSSSLSAPFISQLAKLGVIEVEGMSRLVTAVFVGKYLATAGSSSSSSANSSGVLIDDCDQLTKLSPHFWNDDLMKMFYQANKESLSKKFPLTESVKYLIKLEADLEGGEDSEDEDDKKKKQRSSTSALTGSAALPDSISKDTINGGANTPTVEDIAAINIDFQRRSNTRLLHELEMVKSTDGQTTSPAIVTAPGGNNNNNNNFGVDDELQSDDEDDTFNGIRRYSGETGAARSGFDIIGRIRDAFAPAKPEGRYFVQASVRVEPKTFFANERTLLTWINSCVMLVAVGITMLNYGALSSRIAGLITSALALVVMVIAYRNYTRRAIALENKLVINYYSKTLPIIITSGLILSLLLLLLFRHELRTSVLTYHHDEVSIMDAIKEVHESDDAEVAPGRILTAIDAKRYLAAVNERTLGAAIKNFFSGFF